MKKEKIDLRINDFEKEFLNIQNIPKKDIKEFYFQWYPNLTDQTFRRVIYSLEKNNVITSSGSGMYYIFFNKYSSKKKFVPSFSKYIEELNLKTKTAFPYVNYLIWETRILGEFMIHQPGQNQIILETEKGTEESIFNSLSEEYKGIVFLDPDRLTIERYVLDQPETILISKMVTQTPMGRKVNGVPYAKIEKILLDLLVNDNRYYIFQGKELVAIYENVFSRYLIDEKSLLRYAGRRKAIPKLKQFILEKTNIEIAGFKLENI